MSGEINEDVVEDPFHQVKGRTVPIDLHREIMKLARLVELESLLSEDSAVDDYAVVIDEATHRLERLLASPPSAQEVAHAKAAKLTKEDQKILSKSKQYEDELLQSLKQIDQRDEWYEKYKRLAVKLQKQKSQQGVLEEFVQSQNKKIAVLVDHVDKLMKAVKLENTKRMKVIDDARKMQREEDALRSKIERQSKVILTQQR